MPAGGGGALSGNRGEGEMKIATVAMMFCIMLAMLAGYIDEEFRYDAKEYDMADYLAMNFAACRTRFVEGSIYTDQINVAGSKIRDYAGACTSDDTGVNVYFDTDTRLLTIWLVDSANPGRNHRGTPVHSSKKPDKPQGTARIQAATTVGRQYIPAKSLMVQYQL